MQSHSSASMMCTKKPLLVEHARLQRSLYNATCLDNAFVCIQSLHLRIPPRVLHFSAIHFHSVRESLMSLKSGFRLIYVIQTIRKYCAECYDLNPSFLRPGVFLCHGNPSKTTYRSTPFPTTTTARLVGIIQSWVSMGPSLILDGLLVKVSGECLTAISSLDEGECESGVSGDPGLGQRITQTLNECAVRNLGQEVCSLGGCPLPD